MLPIISDILSVVYPRYCAGCGQVMHDEEEYVCRECLNKLEITEEAEHRGNRLEQLFKGFYVYQKEEPLGEKFERGAAYTYYAEKNPIRQIVHNFKFAGGAETARYMGHRAAEHMMPSGFFEGIDLLIPVPLHPDRMKQRGFNQSEWLAKGISEVTGLPIDTTHLYRTEATEKQSLKTMEDRRKMPSVFALHNADELRGKHVMVVDDIVTSGTTMARALEPFHPVRQCRYSVFAIAYAIH